MKVSFASCSATTASSSAAVNKYLRQSPPSNPYIRHTLNPVWDAFAAIWSLLSHPKQHTYVHTFHCQHSTYPARMAASIFHNAPCSRVRYGPWFHLCGAMVALLSVLKWNSCGSMSLICQSQTDGVFTCCTATVEPLGFAGDKRSSACLEFYMLIICLNVTPTVVTYEARTAGFDFPGVKTKNVLELWFSKGWWHRAPEKNVEKYLYLGTHAFYRTQKHIVTEDKQGLWQLFHSC